MACSETLCCQSMKRALRSDPFVGVVTLFQQIRPIAKLVEMPLVDEGLALDVVRGIANQPL